MKKRLISAVLLAAILGLAACAESDTGKSVTQKQKIKGLSKKYADLDNRCFIYDGHLYTLGKSKLQDVIDNGVEFTETVDYDEIFQRKLTGDLSFDIFYCAVNDGQDFFGFLNPVDLNVPKRNCILAALSCNTVENGEENKFKFAFPQKLTKEELIKNSGEPTSVFPEFEGYGVYIYKYTVPSELYPKYDSGYGFYIHEKDEYLINDTSYGIDFYGITWLP
jgi:hypothetical protein